MKNKENQEPKHFWGEKMGGENQEPNLGSKTPSTHPDTHRKKMTVIELATSEFHLKQVNFES